MQKSLENITTPAIKRIVHVVNSLQIGGSSKVVMDLCQGFAECDLHVVSLTANVEVTQLPEWPSFVKVMTFNHQEDIDYSLRGYFRNLYSKHFWRATYKDVIAYVAELQPDIIHCHLQPRELLIFSGCTQTMKRKFLFTDHSTRIKKGEYPWLNTQLLAWIYRKIYKDWEVVAVSKSVFDCQVQYKLIGKHHSHTLITNGVDTDFFVSDKKSVGPLKIVYVARLHGRKGHDTLIKAWSMLPSTAEAELILVGGGEEQGRLMELVRRLCPRNPVKFLGNSNMVLSHLQEAHIGVFPSLNEGLPLALLEMMSCSLPVLVSDIPEFQDIVHENINGLFFRTGDAEDLCQKLARLIGDAALRDRLGEAARRYILTNYQIGKLILMYKQVYQSILIRQKANISAS